MSNRTFRSLVLASVLLLSCAPKVTTIMTAAENMPVGTDRVMEELPSDSLLTTIRNQGDEIEMKDKEITRLKARLEKLEPKEEKKPAKKAAPKKAALKKEAAKAE